MYIGLVLYSLFRTGVEIINIDMDEYVPPSSIIEVNFFMINELGNRAPPA